MKEVIEGLLASIEKMEPAALATVVEVKGASPAQVGFKLLGRPDGSAVGNVGGGALEQRVREEAVDALQEGRSRLVHYVLREKGPEAVGMLCGGEVTVFIEVYPELVKMNDSVLALKKQGAEVERYNLLRQTKERCEKDMITIFHVPLGPRVYSS